MIAEEEGGNTLEYLQLPGARLPSGDELRWFYTVALYCRVILPSNTGAPSSLASFTVLNHNRTFYSHRVLFPERLAAVIFCIFRDTKFCCPWQQLSVCILHFLCAKPTRRNLGAVKLITSHKIRTEYLCALRGSLPLILISDVLACVGFLILSIYGKAWRSLPPPLNARLCRTWSDPRREQT